MARIFSGIPLSKIKLSVKKWTFFLSFCEGYRKRSTCELIMSLIGMLKDALLSFSPDNRVNYLGLGYCGKVKTVYLKNVREYLRNASIP